MLKNLFVDLNADEQQKVIKSTIVEFLRSRDGREILHPLFVDHRIGSDLQIIVAALRDDTFAAVEEQKAQMLELLDETIRRTEARIRAKVAAVQSQIENGLNEAVENAEKRFRD